VSLYKIERSTFVADLIRTCFHDLELELESPVVEFTMSKIFCAFALISSMSDSMDEDRGSFSLRTASYSVEEDSKTELIALDNSSYAVGITFGVGAGFSTLCS
jgi:hypothetical protein